jgi:hypothetical protein
VIWSVSAVAAVALGALLWLRPWETQPEQSSPSAPPSPAAAPSVAAAATTQPAAAQPMNVGNAGDVRRRMTPVKPRRPTTGPTNPNAWLDTALTGNGSQSPNSTLINGQPAGPIDLGPNSGLKPPDFSTVPAK